MVREASDKMAPPSAASWSIRMSTLLHVVSLPLTAACLGAAWYIVDGDSATSWDGTNSGSVEVQAGKLTLTAYQDCAHWWSERDWDFCDLYVTPFSSQSLSSDLTGPSNFALAAYVIGLLSTILLLGRHWWRCGPRLSRKGDEWYLSWVRVTQIQLALNVFLMTIAIAVYGSGIPKYISSTVGPGNHKPGPAFDLAIAVVVFHAIALCLYTRYVFIIKQHAAAHVVPELPPPPPPAASPEDAQAQWAAQTVEQHAALMGLTPQGPEAAGAMVPTMGVAIRADGTYTFMGQPVPPTMTMGQLNMMYLGAAMNMAAVAGGGQMPMMMTAMQMAAGQTGSPMPLMPPMMPMVPLGAAAPAGMPGGGVPFGQPFGYPPSSLPMPATGGISSSNNTAVGGDEPSAPGDYSKPTVGVPANAAVAPATSSGATGYASGEVGASPPAPGYAYASAGLGMGWQQQPQQQSWSGATAQVVPVQPMAREQSIGGGGDPTVGAGADMPNV